MRWVRVLGLDPGKVNFAWVLLTTDGPQASGWLQPIASVQDDAAFVNGYLELLSTQRPDYVAVERFTVRNRGQSVHAETINQMIGRVAVLTALRGLSLIQVTASTWKVWHQRQGRDPQETYAQLPSVHLRDAAGIAEYVSASLSSEGAGPPMRS